MDDDQQPSAGTARQRLLDAAIGQLAEQGISDLSLRQLATALGTSHRMLIYHFGSKEGLLVAVVKAIEERNREALLAMEADLDQSPLDVARGLWQLMRDPAIRPQARLFFEVYSQALQGRPYASGLLDGLVEDWLRPAVARLRSLGVPEREARAQARLGLAVSRGLLLDLLTTGDEEGVDDATLLYLQIMRYGPDATAPVRDLLPPSGGATDGGEATPNARPADGPPA
ncbi:TetR/AcrR family transcriptional regulator [Plantactinospora siamensis]|uniref:TetR/AcrR family transcriptional regulator n=1 Tax=Plantactinospora siamensis TaxID=555372 RepID=A0ABV6NZ86_9ACTN